MTEDLTQLSSQNQDTPTFLSDLPDVVTEATDGESRRKRKKVEEVEKQYKIKKAGRVRTKRSLLFHILLPEQQKMSQLTYPTMLNAYLYGVVHLGNSKKGYNVKFDILPSSCKI